MSLPYEILECTGGNGKEVMHISAVKFVPQGSLQSHLRTLSKGLESCSLLPTRQLHRFVSTIYSGRSVCKTMVVQEDSS